MFLPPPMDGTFSLGIYDAKGKLVRTLHREAKPDEFSVALNGFITHWNGKDDNGAQMPAGKYFARGFCVGEPRVKREAFLCNDFVTDEKSPHVWRLRALTPGADKLMLTGETISHDAVSWIFNFNGTALEKWDGAFTTVQSVAARNGKVVSLSTLGGPTSERVFDLQNLTWAVDACSSSGAGVWVIDYTPSGTELKEYSDTGELQMRMPIPASEPQPWMLQVIPNQTTQNNGGNIRIFLLEGREKMHRVREIEFSANTAAIGAQTITDIKTIFEKSIRFSDTLEQVRDELKTPDGKLFAQQEKVKLTLRPNPLNQEKSASLEVAIGIDAKGSFLKTADGLPLARISATPLLKWAAITRGAQSGSLVLFQSDSAVVEEFAVSKLANMMAFDCGDFDYDPTREK